MVAVADVREVGAAVAELARVLEPAAVALPDALRIWEAFDRISRHAETAKLLLTTRVDESRVAQRSGHRDTAELLAKKAGRRHRQTRHRPAPRPETPQEPPEARMRR
jgi:hypothetical protein